MESDKSWREYLPKFLQEKGSEISEMSDNNSNASYYSDNDSNNSIRHGRHGYYHQGQGQGPTSPRSSTSAVKIKYARRNRKQRYRSRSPARSRSRSVRSFDSYSRSLSRSPVKHKSRSQSPLSQHNYRQSPDSVSRTPSPGFRRRSKSRSRKNMQRSSYTSPASQSPETDALESSRRQRGFHNRSRQRTYDRRSRSRTPDLRNKFKSRSPSISDDGRSKKIKYKSGQSQRSRSPTPHGSDYSSSSWHFSDDDAAKYQNVDGSDDKDEEIDMPVMGRLFVGNLNHKACKLDMKNYFDEFGNCEIYIGRNPGGYAFIQYDNDDDAIRCIKALDKTEILGTQVSIKPCLPRVGGRIPRGKPGYVRGRTHSWIGLDGTKHNRQERLARGEWPFVHKEPPGGNRGGRGGKFGTIRGRGKGGFIKPRGRGRGSRSFIGRGRGANIYETDTGYGDDEESDYKPPKAYKQKGAFQEAASNSQGEDSQGYNARIQRQKRGGSKEQRFRSRSPVRNRPVLLETPTFKQPLLPTPPGPPLAPEEVAAYTTKSSKKGHRRGKSSIYKKYAKGNKYTDYRYDREHRETHQSGPGLWGDPEDKRSDRTMTSDAHYSNYEWPSTSSQQSTEYEQHTYRPATGQQQQGGYDYSAWPEHQQQAPAPPVPPSPAPPVYTGYDQSGYSQQASNQWSYQPAVAPAAASAGGEYQYQQQHPVGYEQSAYQQPSYGEAAAGYQAWSSSDYQTTQQGYGPPSAASEGPMYTPEQLVHLAKQFPELASSNVLAQVTKEQSKKSKQDSSSRGKSKKKSEGYERLAVAYERLASVLEKAFKEDPPKPPMPPRAATPGHRSPERQSPPRRRAATPTQDEMVTSRRTVVFPGREYTLF